MLHLAQKAFYPAPLPFPLLHVDTTWKFKEMIEFRDRRAKEVGMDLIVYSNPEGVADGVGPFTHGSAVHTDIMKTQALKKALDKYEGALIVVSHDRSFLKGMTEKVIEFRDSELYEHLGDIEYFLGRREMDNMRDVELSKPKNTKVAGIVAPIVEIKPEIDHEELKKLKRQLQYVERDINKLEEKIAAINIKLAESLIDAFDSEDTAIVLWDKNDNVLYRNKKTSERWLKLNLDFDIGQNFFDRLQKVDDLKLLSKQEQNLRKSNYLEAKSSGNSKEFVISACGSFFKH